MSRKSELEKQFLFYENQMQQSLQKILHEIKLQYEMEDQTIFQSEWRKEQGYIPHGTRTKILVTVFGTITYKRHRYRIWKDGRFQFVYLSDNTLGIEKYQRITHHLQMKIIALVGQGKRYQDILDCFPNLRLKPQLIGRLIKRTNLGSLAVIVENFVKPVKLETCLYINIDDTFLTLKQANKKQKFRIRIVAFHDGYDQKKSSPQKKVLKNLRVFTYVVPNDEIIVTKNFTQQLQTLAQKFYENSHHVKTIITGDGAPWIRECHQYWPNSYYILDKFHAIRKIRQVFNPKNLVTAISYQQLKTFFLNGEYELLMTYFQDQIRLNPWNEKIRELKNYFERNEKFQGVRNQKNFLNIGCSIESAISHNIKSLLGYGAKVYSKDVFCKILTIHLAKVNGVDIMSLIKANLFNVRNTQTVVLANSAQNQLTWIKTIDEKVQNPDLLNQLVL